MATPTVYVLCDQNCKFESLTKEQILTAIMQAVNEGTISNIDTGFVQTIKTINGTALKFFVGTQAEYEALAAEDKENLFAIITNDTTKEGLLNAVETLQTDLTELRDGLNDGSIAPYKAQIAESIKSNARNFVIAAGNGSVAVETGYFKKGSTYVIEVGSNGKIGWHATAILTVPTEYTYDLTCFSSYFQCLIDGARKGAILLCMNKDGTNAKLEYRSYDHLGGSNQYSNNEFTMSCRKIHSI